MSNSTATSHANPPLPFTNDAIVNQLRHQATNGPAYVQHSATKALAHIKGLYAHAHYEARLAFETARLKLRDAAGKVTERVADEGPSVADRVAGLLDGTLQPTPEELAYFDRDTSDEDDDHAKENEDEPH